MRVVLSECMVSEIQGSRGGGGGGACVDRANPDTNLVRTRIS